MAEHIGQVALLAPGAEGALEIVVAIAHELDERGIGREHGLDCLERDGSGLGAEGGTLHRELALEPVDAIVECSAEPSALTGVDGRTGYALNSNLVGAYNCLELARRDAAQVVFLSTSRVYPYAALDSLFFGAASPPDEGAGAVAAAAGADAGVAVVVAGSDAVVVSAGFAGSDELFDAAAFAVSDALRESVR